MKKLLLMLLLMPTIVAAQRNEVFSSHIRSLWVVAGDRWQELPVIRLNGDEPITVSFDDMTHEYRRYTYRVEHCEADWTTSEDLLTSDFVEGFAEGNTIDDVEESLNTTHLYTHYKVRLPNRQCRLRMSGNYRLTVIDEDNGEEPVLQVCFMVLEPLMGVSMEVTANTDQDLHNRQQQVSMKVNYGGQRVVVPEQQIKTVVMQNDRWDNARVNSKAQYLTGDGMEWQHNADFIFMAGNEYRKFEILDVTHPTMGIDVINWDGENYHAFPFECEPRRNYVYDEDANGAFYIRNSENIENDRLSEYVYVHYVLHCDTPPRGDVYLNGRWTNDRFLPEYKMEYNAENRCYEATVLQKQGYYNYQFLLMRPDGTLVTMPTEGDFYQTENRYTALVYYRGQGERTDRLVGYQSVCTR